MALPGPAKGLAVATVTYINYPSQLQLQLNAHSGQHVLEPSCAACPARGDGHTPSRWANPTDLVLCHLHLHL